MAILESKKNDFIRLDLTYLSLIYFLSNHILLKLMMIELRMY